MIGNYIRKAAISFLIGDDSNYPLTQVEYNGVPSNAQRMSVYGVSSHPPRGALAMLLAPSHRLDDPIAIIDDVINRFKPLLEGEVKIGSYITKASMYFKSDGSIDIDVPGQGNLNIDVVGGGITINVGGTAGVNVVSSGNITLTCPTVAINGNLTVTGTITGTLDVLGGPLATSLSLHTHTITGGSSAGTTSAPNP